jgi:tellurite resistance protein TerC
MSGTAIPLWVLGVFAGVVAMSIGIDLASHRSRAPESKTRAFAWSAVWIATSLLFCGFLAIEVGSQAAEEFLGAYLLEKSLSVDNLFVFIVIFRRLEVPQPDQRRVLFWGILGALATRGAFVALGATVLERWHFVAYVFGAILVYTGARMVRAPADGETSKDTRILSFFRKHLRYTPNLHGRHFIAREKGRLFATPLLFALIVIELTDVVFAFDSVPAAFAVTRDPLVIYTANVFAVLGLRALYVALAGALGHLRHLHYGLAAVLVFAGAKMLLGDVVRVGPLVSLAIIVCCIGAAVVASVVRPRGPELRHGASSKS